MLVSPTRSSLVGTARAGDVERLIAWHNGELEGEPGPAETELQRPWKLADALPCRSREIALRVAWKVHRKSGVRARWFAFKTCRKQVEFGQQLADDLPDGEAAPEEEPPGYGLDGHTFVEAEFCNPSDPTRSVTVRTFVDTGSADCDLRQEFIDALGLPLSEDGSGVYETAAGRVMEQPEYKAVVRVQGREASVSVNPIDELEEEEEQRKQKKPRTGDLKNGEEEEEDIDEVFGFAAVTDEALLGSGALAALGLLVDCRSRRLVPPPGGRQRTLGFKGQSPHVRMEVANPHDPSRSTTVCALVDTGSTDMDLHPSVVETLGLQEDASELRAKFETAGGVSIEAPMYRVLVRLLGREACVLASPSEPTEADGQQEEGKEEEDEEDEGDDEAEEEDDDEVQEEALLGHDALAALNLLVDCRRKRLVAVPAHQEKKVKRR